MSITFLSAPLSVHADFWPDLLNAMWEGLIEGLKQNQSFSFNIDNFCTQFAHDLKGIPPSDIDAIIRITKTSLTVESQRRTITADQATQIAKSAIAEQYRQKYTPSIEKYYLPHDRPAVSNSLNNNIHTRLGHIEHINGESLAQFFCVDIDQYVKKEADYKYGRNQTQSYTPTYQTPTIPVNNYQQRHTADHLQRTVDEHAAELKHIGMSENDIHDYSIAYWDKNNCNKDHFTVDELIKCSKRQIRRILIENLHVEKRKLETQMKNQTALRNVINKVEGQIQRDVPDDVKPFKADVIRKYLGSSLRQTILQETDDLRCPACLDEYKDELVGGQAGIKVMVPCASNKHHVCHECAPGINECHYCKTSFTKEQMNQKIKQAEAKNR